MIDLSKINWRVFWLGFVMVILLASSLLAGGILTCRNSGGYMSGLKCYSLEKMAVCPLNERYITPVEWPVNNQTLA